MIVDWIRKIIVIKAVLVMALFVVHCSNDDTLTRTPKKNTKIHSVEPTSGPIDQIVVVEGLDFGDRMEHNTVKFNGHSATIITASTTRLVVVVPKGAKTGPITVSVGSKTAKSNVDFVVIP